MFHNTDDISVRKLIINTLIREIIYYPDKLIITYNFTNPTETIKIDKGETEKIEKQCETAYHIDIGSSIKTSVPPKKGKR